MGLVFRFLIIFLVLLSVGAQAGENHITVYNNDLALVKQARFMTPSKNSSIFKFTDVAAQLMPTSVHIRPLNAHSRIAVLEQNFEYDLVSSEKILEKYIGQPIEIVNENGDLFKGVLLSKKGGSIVLDVKDGIKIIPWSNRLTINVKDLPQGLITRPTLLWELTGADPKGENLEVSYLTRGMNWHAEYVGVINASATRLQLDAWVSVDNRCGSGFFDTGLKLVAGEVHRAKEPVYAESMVRGNLMAKSKAVPAFKEKSFFEYHIYELDRKTDLKNNQTKQIALFPTTTLNCRKQFTYNADHDPEKVDVKLIFKNKDRAGKSKPLPKGVFRIFLKDDKNLEFAGEDRIGHTGRNETVKLTMGNAFDLAGEKKIISRKKISKRSERQTIEIALRNNKPDQDVNIIVEERLSCRNWEIETSSLPFIKKDAYTIEFSVPVKADKKAELTYTVLCSW